MEYELTQETEKTYINIQAYLYIEKSNPRDYVGSVHIDPNYVYFLMQRLS